MLLPPRFRRTAPRKKIPVLLAFALLATVSLLSSPGSALASGSPATSTTLAPSFDVPSVSPAFLALQQAELTGQNGTENDAFGFAVALSGNTALVGAPSKTVNGLSQAGAAYVFVRSGTTWTQQAELTAPDAAAGDQFGYSVALSGDTALVGADLKTVGAKARGGTAYVFVCSGTTWTQQAELPAPSPTTGGHFGWAVSLSGDRALIGAPGQTVRGLADVGAAYVFTRADTSWTRQADLAPYDNPPGDGVSFGASLALSGDTALIGAPALHTAKNQIMGGAYVFVGSGATWLRQALLRNPHPATDGGFADALALDGNRALIGVPDGAVGTYSDAGVAYVLVRSGTHWSRQARLSDPHPTQYDSFGGALALSRNRALIGAKLQSFGRKYFVGAGYLFVHSRGRWSLQPPLRDLDQSAGGGYGRSVALSGDTTLAGALGGGFKRSSQRSSERSCDEHEEAGLRSGWSAADALAGASTGRAPRTPATLLDGDRAGAVERGCGHRGGGVGTGRLPLVPGGWRDAIDHHGPDVGALPVVSRAGRDCAAPRPRLRRARDRACARSLALDDLAGAPSQRRDPWRGL